jgi:hypothetical protein
MYFQHLLFFENEMLIEKPVTSQKVGWDSDRQSGNSVRGPKLPAKLQTDLREHHLSKFKNKM